MVNVDISHGYNDVQHTSYIPIMIVYYEGNNYKSIYITSRTTTAHDVVYASDRYGRYG